MAEESAIQIRLGLVLYGGSSLAVYMNGMTRELLALVRASHARTLAGTANTNDWVRDQLAHNPYCQLLDAAKADVVIDVIAGTSAGGLNGLMLAKALACGAPDMDGLTRLWREVAQIYKLAMYDQDPKSVLSGDYMYAEMVKVMEGLSQNADPVLADQVEILDLFVTATDVRGHRWVRRDKFQQKLEGMEHKYLFHLKKRTPYGRGGYHQNDFLAAAGTERVAKQANLDRLLAKIGRATSAFPGVFPPVRISQADAKAAGVDILGDLGKEHKDGIWFSDGGILANKPFEPVLQTIFNRSADKPVKRVLAFLEPDPEVVLAVEQTEPTMVETAMAGFTLPMQQNIHENLEQLKAENERREQFRHLVEGLVDATDLEATMRGEMAKAASGLLSGPAEALKMPQLENYYRMRLERLRDLLVNQMDLALEGLGISHAADRKAATQAVIDRIAVFAEMRPSDPETSAFLSAYDAEFHTRRLQCALGEVQRTYQPGKAPSEQKAMQQVVSGLWAALEDWQNATWVISHAGTASLDNAFRQLAGWVHDRNVTGAADHVITALSDYLQQVRRVAYDQDQAVLDAVTRAFPPQAAEPGAVPKAGGGTHRLTADALRLILTDFEPLDVMLFPLQICGHGGDWNTIGLYRLCPGAARGWVDKDSHQKLNGISVGHFGAFLDERWRANDIMWGRLDGAELLVRMVCREAGLSDLKQGEEPEVKLPLAVREVLDRRRREIIADFPDLIDPQILQQTTGRVAPGGSPERPRASWKQRFQFAFAMMTTGQIAAAAMPPEADALANVSGETIRNYLARRYSVGGEGLDALPPRRLAGETLLILYNIVHALRKPSETSGVGAVQRVLLLVMNLCQWLVGLILIPITGFMGLIQGNLPPLMSVTGLLLLALQIFGGIALYTTGWVLTVILLTPLLLDAIFRPTLLRVIVTGLLGVFSLLGRIRPALTGHDLTALPLLGTPLAWLRQLNASWLDLLGRAWVVFGGLFIAIWLVHVFNGRSRQRANRVLLDSLKGGSK